jgi:pilus assembly protein CpaE
MALLSSSPSPDIVLVSGDPELKRRLTSIAAGIGRSVAHSSADPLARRTDSREPRLIVLDVGAGEMLDDPRLFDVRQRLGSVPLIAVSNELAPERVRQLLRLQAIDWLTRPFSDAEFAKSISQAGGGRGGASKVSIYLSATGGAGATSLALMAAQSLQRQGGAGSTCIVDLDFQHASCGVYLGLKSEFDLDAVIAQPERLDHELLELLKLERAPGLTLYSFERPDLYFSPSGREFVLKLLDLVAAKYANVVIDLPYLETPWFEDVVSSSDQVVVVFQPNVASMRHARRALRRVKELGGGGGRAVANRASFALFGNTITRKDVAKMLTDVPVFYLREDTQTMTDAVNRALFPSEVAGNSSFTREVDKLLGEINGAGAPDQKQAKRGWSR